MQRQTALFVAETEGLSSRSDQRHLRAVETGADNPT